MESRVVMTTMTAGEGQESDLMKLLQEFVQVSRQDEACEQCDLHQGLDNPSIFMLYEVWLDESVILSHVRSSFFCLFKQKTGSILQTLNVVNLRKQQVA